MLQDSILALPLISQPIAKRAIANTIITKAMTKVKNRFGTQISYLVKEAFEAINKHAKKHNRYLKRVQ